MITLERLTQLLVEKYKVDPALITLDAPLGALGLDSLSIVELLYLVEDEFDVKLPPDTDSLVTLGDVLRCVEGLIAHREAAALAVCASSPMPGSPQPPQ